MSYITWTFLQTVFLPNISKQTNSSRCTRRWVVCPSALWIMSQLPTQERGGRWSWARRPDGSLFRISLRKEGKGQLNQIKISISKEEMGPTCHYPSNEYAHVGTQRAGPEQTQGTVRFPAPGSNKDQSITSSMKLILCNLQVVASCAGRKLTWFKRLHLHQICPAEALVLH